MLKAVIRSRGGNIMFGWIVAAFIGILMTSIAWRRRDRQDIAAALAADVAAHDRAIIVFWHDRILAMPFLWPSAIPLYALQSPHADGRMMAHCIHSFGVKTIWGSSNRSALSSLRDMLRALEDGACVAITPDGPRGPAHRAALGPIALARMSGRPIIPLSWATGRAWRASGWDQMWIPKPCSRGRFLMGTPILVAADAKRAEMETDCASMETALTALGEEADALARDWQEQSDSPCLTDQTDEPDNDRASADAYALQSHFWPYM